jgi:hypothetical protein
MTMAPIPSGNFGFLAKHDAQLGPTTTVNSTSRGQSVGCHLNNAKAEQLENPLY